MKSIAMSYAGVAICLAGNAVAMPPATTRSPVRDEARAAAIEAMRNAPHEPIAEVTFEVVLPKADAVERLSGLFEVPFDRSYGMAAYLTIDMDDPSRAVAQFHIMPGGDCENAVDRVQPFVDDLAALYTEVDVRRSFMDTRRCSLRSLEA
jgi:hypothetical protein